MPHRVLNESMVGMIDPCPVYHAPWWHWHLAVGISVGVLAAVGVIIPWFTKDEARNRTWKIIWSIVMCLLVAFEVWNIETDQTEQRKEHASELCEEKQSFDKLQAEAQDSLLAVTGTDSYADIAPQHDPHGPEGTFKFGVTVFGKHTVWDAEMDMREGLVDEGFYTAPRKHFTLKPLPTTHMDILPYVAHPSKDKPNTYGFVISSRGNSESITLMIRFNAVTKRWEYARWLYVQRSASKSPGSELLNTLNWTVIPTMLFTQGDQGEMAK